MVLRKNVQQIKHMRAAGRIVAEMHEVCARAARPGATTADLDLAAREVLERRNARSNFLGYHGFPAVACISPNEVIVHGIPGDRVLAEGDIVSIDCGAIVQGWHADAAITVPVGSIDETSQRLIAVTRAALDAAIEQVRPEARLGDVGAACERVVRAAGFSVVREYVGHGIGTAMHEPPDVPNTGRPAGGCDSQRASCSRSSRWSTRASLAPASCPTTGPWSRPTAPGPPTSSTPWRSPTTAPRSSPCRSAFLRRNRCSGPGIRRKKAGAPRSVVVGSSRPGHVHCPVGPQPVRRVSARLS